jgi:hypothetical protein
MGLWGRKEVDREVPARSDQGTGVRDSFDVLAIGLAGGTMPRRRALRLFGAALAGTVMASIPGVAWAKPCKPGTLQCGTKCCPRDARCVRGECACPTGERLVGGMCRCIIRDSSGNPTDTCPAGQHCQQQADSSGALVSEVCCPVGTCCIDASNNTAVCATKEEGALTTNCSCLETVEGTTVCVEGQSQLCGVSVFCTSTSECPAGTVCRKTSTGSTDPVGICSARCGDDPCEPQRCADLGLTPNLNNCACNPAVC